MATCGEVLAQLLESYGIDTVFGIPGVHTVELYRGLPATGIRHVTPRHEQGAGFMADGYARVSGRPATCFIITGPGMTNILTAMGQAFADSVPMLVISSVNRLAHLGMGQGRLHELPSQRAMVAGVTAFSHTLLHEDQLPEVLARAFAIFASARPRPVHIEIPIDVITRPADHLPRHAVPLPSRPAPAPEAIGRAAAMLGGAEAPLVLLGGGAVEAGTEARLLIESLGAPFVSSVNARGVLPPGHPLSAGVNLGSPPLQRAVEAADVVLAVGTEMGETEMYPGPVTLSLSGRLIRVDIDPEQLMRGPPAAVPILGDAKLTLAALTTALEACGSTDGALRAAGLRAAARALWPPDLMAHERVLAVVREALPGVVIAGDSTQPVYGGNQFYEPAGPRSWFNSTTGYGTLGYALPAAIGAKLAVPGRPVVVLIGDGGLQFTLPELGSAVEAGTPVIVLLWNNHGYREIRTWMVDRGIPPIGVDIHTPDFLGIARGFGCEARRVTGLEELAAGLAAAGSCDRPTLIELPEDAFLAG